MVFFNVLLKTLGFMTAILIFLITINILINFSTGFNKNQFSMTNGNEDSKNIIASINLNGPILNNYNNFFGNNIYDFISPENVRSYLEELKKLKIKALIININSPGGTVSATSELEDIFINFKNETNAKLYFFTKEILASGGYWVATSADKIFASYGSIIGSIGVSGPSWIYYDTPMSLSLGIFGQSIETKNGIEVYNQNAGQSKDLFNPYRQPKKAEIKHLQNIVNDIYESFLAKVSKSRKIEISNLRNNIGALIYNSDQAKDKFLIDDVIDYETLIDFIVKENNLDDYKIYENRKNISLIESFLSAFKNTNNNYLFNKMCKRLETSINVIIPLFLKEC